MKNPPRLDPDTLSGVIQNILASLDTEKLHPTFAEFFEFYDALGAYDEEWTENIDTEKPYVRLAYWQLTRAFKIMRVWGLEMGLDEAQAADLVADVTLVNWLNPEAFKVVYECSTVVYSYSPTARAWRVREITN